MGKFNTNVGRWLAALLSSSCVALSCCPRNAPESPSAGSPTLPSSGAAMGDAPADAPAAVTATPPSGKTSEAAMQPPKAAQAQRTFAEDVGFLKQHGDVIVLNAESGGRVALSALYQGRVMTSAVSETGASLGYINRDFIAAGKTGTQFDNYGGEDRFWLGPEGGQFALYFPTGKPFEFEHWQTPSAFQEGAWTVSAQDATSVTFTRKLELTNYSGTKFSMAVERTVRLLDTAAVQALLTSPSGVTPNKPAGAMSLDGLSWVAFETSNRITNTGKVAWTQSGGAPSVWILAMYNPSPDTWVVLPFDTQGQGDVVNDTYFGKVPADRLKTLEPESALLFRCDGNHRSKIGLSPSRARSFAGSYSESAQLLTIVHYDKPAAATQYVNSMWEHQEQPFNGDVVNSYNDGPVEPGKPALGGFYEIETSSPAAFLAPGKSLVHTHRTLHFVGTQKKLDPLAQRALGVSLQRVTSQ